MLPERLTPIPGSKPPFRALPYGDIKNPEEADEFNKMIRKIRNQSPSRLACLAAANEGLVARYQYCFHSIKPHHPTYSKAVAIEDS